MTPGRGARRNEANTTITAPWIRPKVKNAAWYPAVAIMFAIGMTVRMVPEP